MTVAFRNHTDEVIITTSASELEDELGLDASERDGLLGPTGLTKKEKSAKKPKYGGTGQRRRQLIDRAALKMKPEVAIKVTHDEETEGSGAENIHNVSKSWILYKSNMV